MFVILKYLIKLLKLIELLYCGVFENEFKKVIVSLSKLQISKHKLIRFLLYLLLDMKISISGEKIHLSLFINLQL